MKKASSITWRLVLPTPPQQWIADTNLGRVKAEKMKVTSIIRVSLPDGREQDFPDLREAKFWVETELLSDMTVSL